MRHACRARSIAILLIAAPAALASQRALAQATPVTQYYYATARRVVLATGQSSPEEVLLTRTLDPARGMITEIACLRDPGRPTFVSPIFMKVAGNQIRIADTADVEHPKMVSGTGVLVGAPWHWTYLKMSMTYLPSGATIEDANYITPTGLIGRKSIVSTSGSPVQLYELDMELIPRAQYDERGAAMGCPKTLP